MRQIDSWEGIVYSSCILLAVPLGNYLLFDSCLQALIAQKFGPLLFYFSQIVKVIFTRGKGNEGMRMKFYSYGCCLQSQRNEIKLQVPLQNYAIFEILLGRASCRKLYDEWSEDNSTSNYFDQQFY